MVTLCRHTHTYARSRVPTQRAHVPRSLRAHACSGAQSAYALDIRRSSEWRQKIFAAFDREVTVPFACGQCDSDRHGNPPTLDAMSSAIKRTSVCQRCRSSWYCSSQCQKAHWPTHKHVCHKPHADIDAVLKEGHAARCDCALSSSIGFGLPLGVGLGLGATPCGSARCPSRIG